MKKKKLRLAVIIGLIAVLVGGCVSNSTSSSPKQIAESFLQGIKEQDVEKIKSVYDVESVDSDINNIKDYVQSCVQGNTKNNPYNLKQYDGYLEKMFDFDYEVSNEKISGDKATVDVKILSYNYGEVFATAAKTIELAGNFAKDGTIDSSVILTKIQEAFSTVQKDNEQVATLNLVKKDGQWIVENIEENEAFLDALTGGLYLEFKTATAIATAK